jgi:hypothetical protein
LGGCPSTIDVIGEVLNMHASSRFLVRAHARDGYIQFSRVSASIEDRRRQVAKVVPADVFNWNQNARALLLDQDGERGGHTWRPLRRTPHFIAWPSLMWRGEILTTS